jgi:hypothetical protein
MSFEAYLRGWLGNYQAVNESAKEEEGSPSLDELLNIIDGGIGGEPTDSIARTTSFESIEQILQRLDVSLLEKVKSNPELQKILLAFVSPGKVEWLGEYLTKSKKSLNSIAADKRKIDTDSNFDRFTKLTLRESDIKSRIYKLHVIFKYAAEAPELDKDTNMLIALKQIDEPIKSSNEEDAPTYKIGKIGRIDNTVKSDEFQVLINGSEETRILRKSELSSLLDINPELAEKAKNLASDSYKKKVVKLVQRTEDTIKKEVANSLNSTAQIISELPNDEKGMERLQLDWKPLIDALGYSKFFTNTIEKKEKEITKNEKPSLRKKNRIKENLMSALRSALLPPMVNGEISEPGGDYYKLFKKLEERNAAWLDAAIREVIIDSQRIAQFNNSARLQESSLEENQLVYLQVSSSWIIKYIESEVDGELSKRDTDNGVLSVKRITQEKEKEIKNYYLSKDFNMKNFKGIQLKPDLRLPLYQRVRLAVSEADRIAESPLKNLLKGLGQIVTGLFSTVPDRGDFALAKKHADQNKAIFNGIFSIIKGGVYGVSKQGGRDFEKGVSTVTNKLRLDKAGGFTPYEKGEGPKFYQSAEKKTNEDAAPAMGTAPGTSMQTPDSLPADTMDMMSLAGPGRKDKNKKKKPLVQRVSSFNDFLKGKN